MLNQKEAKNQAKTPNPFFVAQNAFASPPEKLGFHTVLAKPAAHLPTYAVILMQGNITRLLTLRNFYHADDFCNHLKNIDITEFFSY